MTVADDNMRRMQELDDAWNVGDVEGVVRHDKPAVIIHRTSELPMLGVDAHRAEVAAFLVTFPDVHVENRPYKVLFASGDWVCSVAHFTGTMKGPILGPRGKKIRPTGKSFDVDLCTVARWEDGQISEAYIFYDVAKFIAQIGP